MITNNGKKVIMKRSDCKYCEAFIEDIHFKDYKEKVFYVCPLCGSTIHSKEE